MCRATVFSLITRVSAILRLVRPCATSRSTSSSRAVRSPAAPRWGVSEPSDTPTGTPRARPPPRGRRRPRRRGSGNAPEGEPCPRRLVRRPSAAARATTRSAARRAPPSRRRGPARHGPACVRGGGGEPRRGVRLYKALELVCGGLGTVEVTRREGDLHVRPGGGWHVQRVRALGQRPPERCDGGRRLPLAEPEQRKSGLRFEAEVTGLPVRPRRRRKLAAQPVDLADPVARLAGRLAIRRLETSLPRSTRLIQRRRPGTVELEQLRAMDEAASREADELGLPLAPARKRRRPLAPDRARRPRDSPR